MPYSFPLDVLALKSFSSPVLHLLQMLENSRPYRDVVPRSKKKIAGSHNAGATSLLNLTPYKGMKLSEPMIDASLRIVDRQNVMVGGPRISASRPLSDKAWPQAVLLPKLVEAESKQKSIEPNNNVQYHLSNLPKSEMSRGVSGFLTESLTFSNRIGSNDITNSNRISRSDITKRKSSDFMNSLLGSSRTDDRMSVLYFDKRNIGDLIEFSNDTKKSYPIKGVLQITYHSGTNDVVGGKKASSVPPPIAHEQRLQNTYLTQTAQKYGWDDRWGAGFDKPSSGPTGPDIRLSPWSVLS